MEKIKVRFLEDTRISTKEVMAAWPTENADAEKLFVQILADMGEKLEFTKNSPWIVDKRGEAVWRLCERKSKGPVIKLERVVHQQPKEQNIILGSGPNQYIYFICYRHNNIDMNDVVVMDHPIISIQDIRAIEQALSEKHPGWHPTVVNISLLNGSKNLSQKEYVQS